MARPTNSAAIRNGRSIESRQGDGRQLVLGRWEPSIEGETQSVAVKLALPGSHDNRRDGIPDHVNERASLGHEAVVPRISAMPASGIAGTTESVATSAIKPAPATPLASLEVRTATKKIANCCCSVRSVLVASATKREMTMPIAILISLMKASPRGFISTASLG